LIGAREHTTHPIALVLFAAIYLMLAPPDLAAESAGVCPAAVKATNDHGLERIEIASACRRNESVRASYGSWEQEAAFSGEGVASLAVAITDDKSPIILTYRDETSTEIPVDTSALATVLRITLQWEAPVDLNLHVVEPGGVPGWKGDATAGHAPEQFGLIGKLDLADDGTGVGPFQESYVLSNRLDRPNDIFAIYIENATRGRRPSEDHCGQGQYARIGVNLIVADRGKINRRHIELPAAACNVFLDNREYYLRIPLLMLESD
jgi:hypothetical protein